MTTDPDQRRADDLADRDDLGTRSDHRLPERQDDAEAAHVLVKFSGDGLILELLGDDVDLGTDLKVRHEHRLIAEFRRDAVDGWWFESAAVRPPYRLNHDDAESPTPRIADKRELA